MAIMAGAWDFASSLRCGGRGDEGGGTSFMASSIVSSVASGTVRCLAVDVVTVVSAAVSWRPPDVVSGLTSYAGAKARISHIQGRGLTQALDGNFSIHGMNWPYRMKVAIYNTLDTLHQDSMAACSTEVNPPVAATRSVGISKRMHKCYSSQTTMQ
jgi:hypothetical protein